MNRRCVSVSVASQATVDASYLDNSAVAPMSQEMVESLETPLHELIEASAFSASTKCNDVLPVMDPLRFGVDDRVDFVEEVQQTVVVSI